MLLPMEDDDEYQKSKVALYRELLRLNAFELNVYRHAMELIAQRYPRANVESLLASCRNKSSFAQEFAEEWNRTLTLLDKYDSSPLDEALAAFEKWSPPKSPPN